MTYSPFLPSNVVSSATVGSGCPGISPALAYPFTGLSTEGPAVGDVATGGAGGAPAAGGAIGLLWPMWWLILLGVPLPLLMFFGVGYASIATISISLTATGIFAALYFLGYSTHWQYIVYGVLTFFILLWALRPNIKALMEGRERFHGWRPWKKKEAEAKKSE